MNCPGCTKTATPRSSSSPPVAGSPRCGACGQAFATGDEWAAHSKVCPSAGIIRRTLDVLIATRDPAPPVAENARLDRQEERDDSRV